MIDEKLQELLGLGLPEKPCPGCLSEGPWIGIPGPDQEMTIATYCEHTQFGVARKRYADGSLAPWLSIGPVSAADFHEWLRSWTEIDNGRRAAAH